MGRSSALSPFTPTHAFDLDALRSFPIMPATVDLDLEAGLVSEQSIFRGTGIVGAYFSAVMGRPLVVAD
jgi:hypothetical protein